MCVDPDGDAPWCGVVVGDRVRRVVVRGRLGTRTVDPRHVERLPPLVASAVTPKRVVGLLDALDDAIDRVRPQLEALWRVADASREWPTIDALVAPLGGAADVTRAALHRIALEGVPWFVVEDGALRPTTRAERDAWLRREATQQVAAQAVASFADRIRSACDGEGLDTVHPDLLAVVERCARREDPDDAGHSDRIVDAAAAAAGVSPGPRWRRAFDTLVAAGHWGEDHPVEVDLLQLDRGWPAMPRPAQIADPALPGIEGRVISIDGPGTDDIDDAFTFAVRADGGLDVTVLIAHPPALLALDSPLGREAARRGASVYLPTGTLGMLPPSWSEDLLSLRAGQPRPALAIRWCATPDGGIADEGRLELVRVEVDANLTWAEACAEPEAARWAPLDAWADAARRLRRGRGARFSELPRARVEVGADGAMRLRRSERTSAAHRMIAELMVAANTVAGRWCAARGVVVPWRVQAPPDDPGRIDRWLAAPDVLVGGWRAARAMPPAHTAFEPGPHHGLGVDAYVQITSPVRRFADWIAHAAIRAELLGDAPVVGLEDRVRAAEAAARASARAMRRTHHYWRLKWLAARGDAPLDAVVLRGATVGRKAEVLLVEPLVPVKVVSTADVEPGDRLRVAITRIDPRAGRVRARVVGDAG